MIFVSTLLAIVVGLGTIMWAIRGTTSLVASKVGNSSAVSWAGYVGAAIATVPALFASLTFGGTVGGSWFAALIGPSAIPIGIGIGIFVTLVSIVTSVGVLAAFAAGVLVSSAPQLNGR